MKRSKRKKQQVIEEQDKKGISRKIKSHTLSLKTFVTLKIICIVLIPILYFVYSPLLIVCMLFYILLFYLAIMTERGMNVSVIKTKHITISKIDSAIALGVVVITLFSLCVSGTSKIKSPQFEDMPANANIENVDFKSLKKNSKTNIFFKSLENIGSCLTGTRNVFSSKKSNFGMKEPPKDFPVDKGDLNIPNNMPEFQKPNNKISISDLPIEYMFSTMLTSLNTILIFSVSGVGVVTLIGLYLKKQKFNREVNEVVLDNIVIPTDKEIEAILDFGILVEYDEDVDSTMVEHFQEDMLIDSDNAVLVEACALVEESKETIGILQDDFDINTIYKDK